MDSKTQKLASLIRKLSYHEGDFVLSSGQKSSLYIDLKATTLHPDGAALIAEVACDLILEKEMQLDGVGGLTLGADPLATALSLEARKRGLFWPAFIVRKEPKGHGTARYIEGSENLKAGARVLVLEDVVTTGASSLRAIERLRDSGFSPVAALTVVDREQQGRISIESSGVKFLKLLTISEVRAAET